MSMFTKATKHQAKGRLSLTGKSGGGKTFTALMIATHLGGRVALIDTERGSAKKYATREGEKPDPSRGKFDFFHLDLESYDPRKYIEAIKAAEGEGFNVLIIDSLSHAWMGKGGALEMVDNAAKKGG